MKSSHTHYTVQLFQFFHYLPTKVNQGPAQQESQRSHTEDPNNNSDIKQDSEFKNRQDIAVIMAGSISDRTCVLNSTHVSKFQMKSLWAFVRNKQKNDLDVSAVVCVKVCVYCVCVCVFPTFTPSLVERVQQNDKKGN